MCVGECVWSVVIEKGGVGMDRGTEEFLFLVAIALLLALVVVPIIALVQIFKLRSELARQASLLERLLTRREAPPVSLPVIAAAPPSLSTPTPAPATTLAPAPATTPAALSAALRRPTPPLIRPVQAPVPWPAVPSLPSPLPVEPNEMQAKAEAALKKIWNWIVIGDEFRRPGMSWEYAMATNWLLRGGILVLVVGVGLFLKYSIDHGLLGPEARVALSILSGVAMLVGGVRLVGKPYHLLGQGLLGGGLAILYFSMFAASNLYHLIGGIAAFGLMALVTLVAGTLAVRLNSLLVAVLGILGGYGTPIILSTGAKNFPGLFGYMLLLGVGILGIARLRHWPLLNYLGLLLTYGLAAVAIERQYVADDLAGVLPFLVAFFVLYAAVMILHNMVHRQKAGLLELLGIMANALMFFGLAHYVITYAHPAKFAALPALALAAFFIVLARLFLAGGRKDRGLLYTFLAMAALFTALTPPLALSRQWVTASWALQGVVMLWLAGKIESRFLRLLGSAACLLAIGRLACVDLQAQFQGHLPPDMTWTAYLKIFGERVLAIGVPIAALGAPGNCCAARPPRVRSRWRPKTTWPPLPGRARPA